MKNDSTLLHSASPEDLTDQIASEVVNRLKPLLTIRASDAAVSREEMAKLLGVGTATIDRMVKAGEVPSLMAGRRRMFLPSKVFAALSQKGEAGDE